MTLDTFADGVALLPGNLVRARGKSGSDYLFDGATGVEVWSGPLMLTPVIVPSAS